MPTTTHIKFDGIEGESTHADHKGEILVASWSWGVNNPPAAGTGVGAAVGKAVPGDFHFTHVYDKASPILAKNCAGGKRVKTVVLTARKAGEGQKDFLRITMTDVLVTAAAVSAAGEGVYESIALSYGQIGFSYQPQTATGGLGSAVAFDWNTRTGKIA